MHSFYKFAFIVSMALMVAAIFLFSIYGLNLGVDFKGGSLMELEFENVRPNTTELGTVFNSLGVKEPLFSQAGSQGVIVRAGEISEAQHQNILAELKKTYPNVKENRFDSIGPSIGAELRQKGILAMVLVLIAVIVYIAIVFQKMRKVVSPWILGFAAILALVHDLIIPLGVFAALGKWYGIEISAVFVAAALTILGYSVADTVVVFDRVRENVIRHGLKAGEFGTVVHKSIMQTLSRSLNTTLTTLLSLLAIYFFGGESIKYFALALILGIFSGAYSSIFIASPLVVYWENRRRKN